VGLPYEDRSLTTDDGVRLHAWHIPNPEARYTAIDFHGNAGNLGDRVDRYAQWHRLGLAVFAVDYRGYGRSEGSPSEGGLYRDARAAWADITGALGIPPGRVIVVGRSLGGGPATQLALEVAPAGLVLETPMTSIPAMARVVYPWLPVSLLARTKFDNLAKIGSVRSPVMVVQAEQDDVIPPWMSRRLFDAAPEPKQWVSLAGGHNDFDEVSRQRYEDAWRTFLGSLSGAP
jgi:fermentation-respiration switch protein FrsA (DUF1100 family)